MSINSENLISAIQSISNVKQTNKNEIKKAEEFLVQAERSSEMWTLTNILLNQDNLNEDVIFYMTKFLKQKMKFDFSQVHQQDYSILFQNLTGYLKKYKNQKRGIKSCLVLAFVYFYMHTFQHQQDLLEYIRNQFESNDSNLSRYILQILEVLPDESTNETVVIDEQQRRMLVEHLHTQFDQRVIELLHQVGQNNLMEDVAYDVLKSFHSWVFFIDTQDAIKNLQYNSVLKLAFNSLMNPELCDKASGVICACIKKFKNSDGNLFSNLLLSVIGFHQQCIQSLNEELIDETDCYVDIYVALGKNFILPFVQQIEINNDNNCYIFLENILEVMSHQNIDLESNQKQTIKIDHLKYLAKIYMNFKIFLQQIIFYQVQNNLKNFGKNFFDRQASQRIKH